MVTRADIINDLKSRDTVYSEDFDALLDYIDQEVLAGGGAGGNYSSFIPGNPPYTTAGGSTTASTGVPSKLVVGTNIVAGTENGVVATLPSNQPRFVIGAGNGGDYSIVVSALHITGFVGGNGGITWDGVVNVNGSPANIGRRFTTGGSIGDTRPVDFAGTLTLAAGDVVEFFYTPTSGAGVGLLTDSFMATISQVG
jgi:hypothetical protein